MGLKIEPNLKWHLKQSVLEQTCHLQSTRGWMQGCESVIYDPLHLKITPLEGGVISAMADVYSVFVWGWNRQWIRDN